MKEKECYTFRHLLNFLGTIVFASLMIFIFNSIVFAAPEKKKCVSSISLNENNIREAFVRKLEGLPLDKWNRDEVLDVFRANIKGKEIILRNAGIVIIQDKMIHFNGALQKRLDVLYDDLYCKTEKPETKIMLDLVRDIL